MGAEYSVNIKLNTGKVRADLKTIGTDISNLGKGQEKASKNTLSATDKKLKLDQKILTFQNRILTVGNSRLKTITAENKLSQTKSLLTRANTQAIQGEFDLSKKNILKAIQQIKLLQKETLIKKGIQTQSTKKVKVEDTLNKQLQERIKLLGQIVKLRNLGTAAGRLAGRFELEESLNTRGPGGRMLALPSSSMLEERVRGSGQTGGFSRALSTPNFLQRIGATRGFDLQSALISGGFPLLFGQGPVTAAAGALGGGIGGMFGQMGGFAGGIAATTAVQSISNFTKAIGDLGNVLSRPTENIGALVEKLGLANDPTGRLALRLEKLGLVSSASALLMDDFVERTGKSPDVLKSAAKEINEMNKSLATLGLKLQLFGAEVITPLVDVLNDIPFGKIKDKLTPLFNFLLFGAFEGTNLKNINKPSTGSNGLSAEPGGTITIGVTGDSTQSKLTKLAEQTEFTRNILPLQQQLDIEKQRFTLNSKEINVKKERNKLDLQNKELILLQKQAELDKDNALGLKIEKLKAEVDLQKQILENAQTLADPIKAQTIQLDQQMKVLMDRGSQIVALSQAISSSFEQSFTGIINGTMSVKDAFRNMLNSIANHFINTAAKMMANQLQRGLLGILGNAFGSAFSFGSSFKNFGSTSVGTAGQFVGSVKGFPTFADGGRPPVGRASIVGERGPELFVPDRAGTIVPNNAMGGSTNIVINVDASGSSVEGDEEQANAFGSAIATAIQSELIKQKRPGGLLA